MLYEFQLGNNARTAARNICAVLGEGTIADRTCHHGFKRFQEDNISLEEYPRSGRSLECEVERLQALIEDNPRLTTHELSIILGYNYSTIDSQLHQWMVGSTPTDATEDHHLQLSVVETQSIQISPAGDSSKLTIDASVNESIVDSESKTDLYPEKIMLSVW